jgi:dynein heavy chain
MYQYSLEFFANLFNKRLDKSEKNEDKDKRIAVIIEDITWSFYVNICRGLFEKDKLMYSFLNTTSIFRESGAISVEEWLFFIRGSTTDYSENKKKVDFVND